MSFEYSASVRLSAEQRDALAVTLAKCGYGVRPVNDRIGIRFARSTSTWSEDASLSLGDEIVVAIHSATPTTFVADLSSALESLGISATFQEL